MFLLVLSFLTGCGSVKSDMDPGMMIRKKLSEGSGCSFHAVITADYSDKIYTFAMDCHVDESGKLTFTVTDPHTISGISGTISESGAGLTFDDKVLAFEMLADNMISPVISPWLLIRSLYGGYISGYSQDAENYCIHIDDTFQGENLLTLVWVDRGLIPKQAEFLYNGKRILSLSVTNFVIL